MARSKDDTDELRSTISSAFPPGAETPPRGAAEIAELIQDLIISQDLSRGARLPSERDLATLFATSRPTISQAIRVLVVRGLVESRRGSGAYVLRRPEHSLAKSVGLMVSLNQDSVPQLAELRLWLETTGATLAVDVATESEIEEIARALDQLRSTAGDVAGFTIADTRFHSCLVEAARNPYLASIYESVHSTLINYEYESWVTDGTVPKWLRPAAYPALVAIHQAILDALIDRDEAAMRAAVLAHHEAMSRHLEAVTPAS